MEVGAELRAVQAQLSSSPSALSTSERDRLEARLKTLEADAALGPGLADFVSLNTGAEMMKRFKAASDLEAEVIQSSSSSPQAYTPWQVVGAAEGHSGRLEVLRAMQSQIQEAAARAGIDLSD